MLLLFNGLSGPPAGGQLLLALHWSNVGGPVTVTGTIAQDLPALIQAASGTVETVTTHAGGAFFEKHKVTGVIRSTLPSLETRVTVRVGDEEFAILLLLSEGVPVG